MTDALPDDIPELAPAVGFDSRRLIALVRSGDQAARKEAYRQVFGTTLGRQVLLDALATIGGIGMARTAETPAESNHTNGRGWAVLQLAELAGFDPVAIAAAGMTQALEGAAYEHGYGPDQSRNPVVAFTDADAEPDGFTGGAAGADFA